MITDLLTGSATNINAPADEQGHGLLNVYAAVRAAQQMPGTTHTRQDRDAQLIASATQTDSAQIDVMGNGGSSSTQDVSTYNTGSRLVTVHGMFRTLGPERQIGPGAQREHHRPTGRISDPAGRRPGRRADPLQGAARP